MVKKCASLYSRVTIKGEQLKRNYTIVLPEEVSISENKISINSPLGAALLSHKVNETVKVKTPKGVVRYKIVGID